MPSSDLLLELKGVGEGCNPRIYPSSSQGLWGHSKCSPLPSTFPSSSREGRICAAAAAVPGTGQLWGSGCFLAMELGTTPGTPGSGGNAFTGIRAEARHHPPCRSMQRWVAPGWICTLNPFPGTREMPSALFPLPGVSSRLVPSSCSLSWSFWALLLPTSLRSCPCWGAMALWGSVVSLLGSGEMFPTPQPRLLGTGHFKGDWLFSSM